MIVQNIFELGRLLDPVRERIPNLEEQRNWAVARPKEFIGLIRRQMELIKINEELIRGHRNRSWKANLCQTVTEGKTCRIARCTFAHQLSLVYSIRLSTNPQYKESGCPTKTERGAVPCSYYDDKNKTWLKCCGIHKGDLQVNLEEKTVRVFRNPEEVDGKEADAISQGSVESIDSQPHIRSLDELAQEIDPLLKNEVPHPFETQIELACQFPEVFIREVRRVKEVMRNFGFIRGGWKAVFCRSLLAQRVCRQKECRYAHSLEILIAVNSRGDFRYKQKACVKQNCEQSGGELAKFGKCRALHPGDLLINWEKETVEIFSPRPFPSVSQQPVFLAPVWIPQFDIYGREIMVPAFMPTHPQPYPMPIQELRVSSLLAPIRKEIDPFDEEDHIAQNVAQSVLATPPRHVAERVAEAVLQTPPRARNSGRASEGEGGGGEASWE